jgi:hypothetical protein
MMRHTIYSIYMIMFLQIQKDLLIAHRPISKREKNRPRQHQAENLKKKQAAKWIFDTYPKHAGGIDET